MQKNLIAAAVAGALGLPVVALAQNATVNVYGKVYMEYGAVKQGANAAGTINRVDSDNIQTGGSELGFRGEEKLGGGLSAWFQCATTMDPRGIGQNGLCSRDSALGLKGAYGNVFMGQWGTPFKRARIYTGSGDTGHYGTSGLLVGHSTTTLDGGAPQLFSRRQSGLITYDSPNFSGVTISAAYTATNNSTSRPELSANPKPRVWGMSVGYANGPLKLNAAYEKHKDILGAGATAAAPVPVIALGGFVGSEYGWLMSGSYTFSNNLTLGGMWTRQTWDTTGVVGAPAGFIGEAHVSAWQLGIDWMISGPHGIRAAYTRAGNVDGNGLAVTGGLRPAAGPSTGARMAQIRYVHKLSKRTELTLGYNQVNNDTFAAYNINGNGGNGGNSGATNGFGGKHNVFAIAMEHNF